MPQYDISTHQVSTALKATSKAAEGFSTDLAPLPGHVGSVSAACGNSGAIVPALDGLFEHEQTALKNMSQQIEACLTGAAAATTAYVQGDLEMMRTYQTNAAQGKVSKLPR